MHYSNTNKSIILQTELEKQIILHYIKVYNYKRLDESQKIRAMICEHKSHRVRPL